MKTLLIISILLFSKSLFAQLSELEILEKRDLHLSELQDSTLGVLNQEEILNFGGLDYFPFDSTFQINASLIKNKGKRFKMPTSTDRLPTYRRYGHVEFTINDSTYQLEVYQNMALRKEEGYEDYLFIPFKDGTTRIETYGGGRYLDIRIPEGSSIVLDFNLAYNPYCAYSYRYSCPIPPAINSLSVKIRAGEKTPLGH